MDITWIADLAQTVDIPENGTLSRTIYQDDQVKVLIFAFDKGESLSEHTASMPAILHFLKGEADLSLGEEEQSAQAGSWVHMPADLPHSIHAKTPVLMLLMLLKRNR